MKVRDVDGVERVTEFEGDIIQVADGVVCRMECVDHDAAGNKIKGHTIRIRLAGGPWFYGMEQFTRDMADLLERASK